MTVSLCVGPNGQAEPLPVLDLFGSFCVKAKRTQEKMLYSFSFILLPNKKYKNKSVYHLTIESVLVTYFCWMSKMQRIAVGEDVVELQKRYKKVAYHLKPRVKMLLVALQQDLHSNTELAAALKVNRNTIQEWKTLYRQGGLAQLLKDKRGGNRASVITPAVATALSEKLTNAKEAPRSFIELWQWIQEHYLPGINYQTLRGYVIRKYGAKIKVVRKTHSHKEEVAVQEFKKK